ncbi:hypothetical protein [Bradyrhizobium sp. BR 10289]|uniref:hypothetical protein n=1 Tax=Bradyrhizobium sp. BR 10289 TaxID=2749993 RepID=UPI0032DFAA52
MTNYRPASWHVPTKQQMEKPGSSLAISRKLSLTGAVGPADDLPPEYWQALLDDPRLHGPDSGRGSSVRMLRLDQIPKHLLRVSCRRCARTVEIQKVDAVRLYGRDAIWRDVGQRLLDNTCTQRTGRHEEDGCWPSYDAP